MVLAGQDLLTVILGVVGVLLFFLPMNKLIVSCWTTIRPAKNKVNAEDLSEEDDENRTYYDVVESAWLAARDKKVPVSVKRVIASACLYAASRSLRQRAAK